MAEMFIPTDQLKARLRDLYVNANLLDEKAKAIAAQLETRGDSNPWSSAQVEVIGQKLSTILEHIAALESMLAKRG